jgi:hypothetical protein
VTKVERTFDKSPWPQMSFRHKYTQGADSRLKERSVTRIARGECIKCCPIRLMDLMVSSLKA